MGPGRYLGWLPGLLTAAAVAGTPLGEAGARHLLERTGFGAPPVQVAEFSRLERRQAVDRLLADRRTVALQPPPPIAYERLSRLKDLSEEERKAVQRELVRQGGELRDWWAGEMLRAPTAGDALAEHMTLFWHNHFVSSQQKVRSSYLMLKQNELLRSQALGNFGQLLHAVAKDPAMVVYLDSATNRKGSPNENFAREVMELFTLGEGRYSDSDVREAARAFTGWSIDPETGDFRGRPPIHDGGEKTVLGRSGNFDGDDVLDILLEQPATAEFIVAKLWREFVSPAPDPGEVRRIAAAFRGSSYEVRAALGPLLLSPAFWAPENRGILVKAPVDWVIGTIRTLDVEVPDPSPLAFALRQLGQDLFAPPNVKGWPGGEMWINATTLLARRQLIDRLLRGEEMPRRPPRGTLDMHFDSAAWLQRYRDRASVQQALLALPAVQPPAAGASGLELLRALLLDPVFQLK
ncbi:MAG: hypothetical protein H6R10_779 [Rhodocyclaceae bacterium]|nr:hypothetical protein [Rhodocyclaceae bacterium]